MRLAFWYPDSTFSAWSISAGAVDALCRMGHDVWSCGIVPGSKELDASKYPRATDLESMDGIIISSPEHIGKYVRDLYPDWELIRVPKVAWLAETVRREDYGQLDLAPIRRMANVIFSPAIQDEEFGFRFLPFGIDMDVFRPDPVVERDIDVCFIGLMYPKRQQYLDRIKPYLADIELKLGNIEIKENGKAHPRKTVLAYAEMLRRIKVFVNLPTLSQLVVTKIYEVAACGACMITPLVKGAGNRNHSFVGEPVRLYDEDHPAKLVEMVTFLLNNPPEQERISRASSKIMYAEHRLELRLQTILDALR
jgi:hypothetical protein